MVRKKKSSVFSPYISGWRAKSALSNAGFLIGGDDADGRERPDDLYNQHQFLLAAVQNHDSSASVAEAAAASAAASAASAAARTCQAASARSPPSSFLTVPALQRDHGKQWDGHGDPGAVQHDPRPQGLAPGEQLLGQEPRRVPRGRAWNWRGVLIRVWGDNT